MKADDLSRRSSACSLKVLATPIPPSRAGRGGARGHTIAVPRRPRQGDLWASSRVLRGQRIRGEPFRALIAGDAIRLFQERMMIGGDGEHRGIGPLRAAWQ